jgi:hypothetical protein
MFDFWDKELSEQETEELIEKAANEIKKRKLVVPAILMFEMHKPLAYVGSQAAIVFSPFLVPFLGFDKINNYSRLLGKRDSIERLLQRLEEKREPGGAEG